MKLVVVSAINVYNAGPLAIVRDFLAAVRRSQAFASGELRVTAFVHDARLYADLASDRLSFVAKPWSRTNWLIRLFYEHVYFARWSAGRDVDAWLSLHDVTPNVRARRQIVYCHNTAIFYDGPSTWWTWRTDPKFELFRRFYGWVFGTNLLRNERVIVQQQWIRDEFARRFRYPAERIIVARPSAAPHEQPAAAASPREPGGPRRLIYPAYPRFFKNHETLLRAMRLLTDAPARLTLTLAGDENGYARRLRDEFGDLPNVEFAGFLPREALFERYAACDALVFPSKLESWGLPLSEFRAFDKPVFAADLPYARETLSGYPRAVFFPPDDAPGLARLLRDFCADGAFRPNPAHVELAPPVASDWDDLVRMLDLARP